MTRVAIIGAGWVSLDRHVPSLRALKDVEIVGVLDRDLARGRELAATHGLGHACRSVEDVQRLAPDAVFIGTPPWAHADVAIAMMEAGAHVFCEKPMAIDTTDARRMAGAARTSGRMLCISHNLLWSRSVREARTFLRGARIDYVMGVQLSSLQRRLPTWIPELPGGLAFDESPHLMYLVSDLIGRPTIDHLRVAPPAGGVEPASVEVLLAGERAHAQVTMMLDASVSEWQVVVSSNRGVVVIDLFRDIALRIRPDGRHTAKDIMRTSARAISDHLRGVALSGTRLTVGRQKWGHDTLIGEFVHSVRHGGPNPVPIDDALHVMELVERVGSAVAAASPAGVRHH